MRRRRFSLWCALFGTALLAAVLLPASAQAQGELAPEVASDTLSRLRFRCAILLCPYSAEVWEVFVNSVASKPGDQYLLGIYLQTGDKVRRDERSGQLWIGLAAAQGYARAALELNRQRRNGAEMIVDEAKIAAAMRAKADAGDADGMRALSGLYFDGRGVERNPDEAMRLLRHAAESGSSEAEQDLANLLLRGGPGVPPNRDEALHWLAGSARHGNTEAMCQLSYNLLTGNGGKAEPVEGFRWLMRAALLDDPEAQERLSQVFAYGLDDEGHMANPPYGRSSLARPRATLIAPDLVQADKWFRLAARSPWHDNPSNRSSIEPKMTSAQLEQARQQVAQWHKLPLPEVIMLDIALPAAPR